jgi:cytidine deaminase
MGMNKEMPSVEQLKLLARSVSENAYSPYSKLKVGAVVVDDHGRTYSGCNLESASYGLTQCAERNALGAAIAAGVKPGELHTLLVYARGFEALSPCGACRQVMSELLTRDATVISCGSDDVVQTWTMTRLFPAPFVLE